MPTSANELNFRVLFESIPGLHVVISTDFIILTASDDFLNSFMVKREEILQQSLFDTFFHKPENDIEDAITNVRFSLNYVIKYKTSHTIPAQRYDIQKPGGMTEIKYWSSVNKPVLNNKNEVAYIILNVQDITDFILLQKADVTKNEVTKKLLSKSGKMELEIIKYTREIQKLNIKLQQGIEDGMKEIVTLNKNIAVYKQLLDSSSIVALIDTNGILLDVNESLCRVSKYTKEELVGQRYSIFNSDFHNRSFIEHTLSTIKKGIIWKGEIKERAKDGSFFWADTTIVPFINENDEPFEYLTVQTDITDYKHSIERLKISEENYRDFFENNMMPMFTFSMETFKTLSVNDKGVAIFGYESREHFLDEHVAEKHYAYPEEREKILNALKETGKTETGKIALKRLDGSIFWASYHININSDKKIAHIVMKDVTQEVNYQNKLIASEKKYRNIFNNSVVGVFSSDLTTLKMIDINEKGWQASGYKSKEDFLENYNPDDHYMNIQNRIDNIKNLKKYGEINNEIVEFKTLKGTRYWTSMSMKVDIENNLIQTVVVDISNQIQFQNNLIASELKYRNLYENSLIAMYTSDINLNRTIEVNDICVELFGYKTPEDFLEHYHLTAHFVNPGESEQIHKMLLEKGEVINTQHELIRRDGSHFWAKFFVKLNFQTNLAQTLLVDVTSQVHHREELETKVKERTIELTKMLDREQGISEMKSRFLSMASHEFRTPLSTILSSIYLIEMYNQTEQQDKRLIHINRIAASVKDLTGILNNFLSLEKLKKGILEISTTLFNLPASLGNIIYEMNEMVTKKNQRIHHVHEGEAVIEQSEKIIRNVLINLISNASKYSDENNDIILTSTVVHNEVIISVKDHGLGIPEEDQPNIFTEFFRAGNVNNIHGTGLGLCIVQKYAELLNGHISFKSKLKEGTTFTIRFPKNMANTSL